MKVLTAAQMRECNDPEKDGEMRYADANDRCMHLRPVSRRTVSAERVYYKGPTE